MKTRKTIWIMILAAVLLLVLPLSALSEEPEEPDDPEVETGEFGGGTWSFNEGELIIDGAADLNNFRPENELDFYRDITWVTFGPQVTNIRADAFACCPVDGFAVSEDNPYYITVEGILYSKDETQLLGVPAAKTGTLDIPSKVTDVDPLAFSHCSISAISVDPGNEKYESLDGVLFNRSMTELVCYPAGKTDSQYTLPESVGLINAYAFSSVKNLREITLFDPQNQEPSKELTIDSNAFRESSLKTVHFPSTLTRIGDSAFQYCNRLTNLTYEGYASEWEAVEIGRNNTPLHLYPVACRENESADPKPETGSIGDGVDYSLDHRTGILTVSGAGTWDSSAFKQNESITEVVLENDVTEIGDSAFYQCSNLKRVHISPDSALTRIGDESFRGCILLKDIEIPADVTEIGDYAFMGCRNLQMLSASDYSTLIRIGDESFHGCFRLERADIPASVREIGSGAFDECYALTDVYFGRTMADWETLMDSREDEWISWVKVHCTDGEIPAANPLHSIALVEFEEDGCPETIRLGEFLTIRVQPQAHVDCYDATLSNGDTVLTAWGSNDGIISFCTWPDDAEAGSYTLKVVPSADDYITFSCEAEATITVTDYERPAVPDMQIRILNQEGEEPEVLYANSGYDMEISWNVENVTDVRFKNCSGDTPNTGTHIVDAREYNGENRYGLLTEMGTHEAGPEYIYVSACIDGVWSLWSNPLVLYPAEKPSLEEPEITLVGKDEPYEYSIGEDVIFSVRLDPNTDYINYYVVRSSDDEEVDSGYDIPVNGNQTMVFTINSDLLDGDTYSIHVSCYRFNEDFQPSWNGESFAVTGSRPAGPIVEMDSTEAQYGDVLHATINTDGAEEVVIETPPHGDKTVWLTDGQEILEIPVRVQFYDYGTLRVRARKDGMLTAWTSVEILSSSSPEAPEPWEVTFPDDIPGETDVAVTVPEAYGAKYYMVWVYGGSDCLYWVKLEEPGTVTIPAVVFEDGGFYSIMAGASNGVSSDWCFKQEEYDDVPSYKSNRGLSVTATQQGEWPFGSTPSFTLTPGAGVTGTMTQVMIQQLIDYSGSSLGPGTEWQIVAMTEAVSNQEYTNRVWLPAADTGAHQYRLAALVGGEWTDWSEPVTVTIGKSTGSLDATDPIVPATIGLGQDLVVSWAAVDHAQNYNVYLTNLGNNEHHIYETGSTATTYTIDKSKLPAGSYGVKIEACADGYESSTGRTRMVSVVPGEFALEIDNSDNYPAGLPVVVGGFRPAGTSGQESFDIVLEQNGTELFTDSFELGDTDDQGRIVLVPRGLDAGAYTIRATRHIPGEEEGEEATCTLTVTGERPAVGTVTVPETEVNIRDEVQFLFSGDRYGEDAYCKYTDILDGQPVDEPSEVPLELQWDSENSRNVFSYTSDEPLQRTYQFQLCCSDGRWTAWTDPVTVTWLFREQASEPTLADLEGSELLAGEPLILYGITLNADDKQSDYYKMRLFRVSEEGQIWNASVHLYDLNPDGSFTAIQFGLDAGAYVLGVTYYENGYENSGETQYHFTVTDERPPAPDCECPTGNVDLYSEAHAKISAEGITGACIAYRYVRIAEVYLPEGDTVYVPLDTQWAGTTRYEFRARVGTQWSEPVSRSVTVTGTPKKLAAPTATVPKTFFVGEPVEVTVNPVNNAEYYTVSVFQVDEDNIPLRGVYYDFLLHPDAAGHDLIPTLDFVDDGRYSFSFSAYADGYDPGESKNYYATGQISTAAADARPEFTLLTENPAAQQDVSFRIAGDPAAEEVSLLVYLVYEDYGMETLLLNESLVPENGIADYTLDYRLVGKGRYRVRAAQQVNGVWSAYSSNNFNVYNDVSDQLPGITITGFPEEIISGKSFSISWTEAEGAESYEVSWRYNRDDIWHSETLDAGQTTADLTVNPAADHKEYYCHFKVSANARGKAGSTAEREAEVLDSRAPALAASRSLTAPKEEVVLTAGNVFGDRMRVSVDNGTPELVSCRPVNGKQVFSLRLDKPGEHAIRVSCGESYTTSRPEYWSCWSDAATVTVFDTSGLDEDDKRTITFNPNGGTGRMANQTFYKDYGVAIPLAANAFTRTGKYFTGWNTEADGSGMAYDDRQAVSPTEDMTLYAQWETKENYFTLDVVDQTSKKHKVGGKIRMSGTNVVDDTVTTIPPGDNCFGGTVHGDALLTLEAIPSDYYCFVGWYSGEELNEDDLTPVELLSEEPILNLELTEHGWENRTMICAVYEYAPAYRTAAFRVPENLTVIPESAFEGIGAATVYVPDTCTEIKANAFKDCGQLRQIRLPKDCVIAPDAFYGCRKGPNSLGWDDENERWEDCSDLLTIFAPAGGTTQAWAAEARILFAAE